MVVGDDKLDNNLMDQEHKVKCFQTKFYLNPVKHLMDLIQKCN